MVPLRFSSLSPPILNLKSPPADMLIALVASKLIKVPASMATVVPATMPMPVLACMLALAPLLFSCNCPPAITLTGPFASSKISPLQVRPVRLSTYCVYTPVFSSYRLYACPLRLVPYSLRYRPLYPSAGLLVLFQTVPVVVPAAVPLLLWATLTTCPTQGILYSPLLMAFICRVTLLPRSK